MFVQRTTTGYNQNVTDEPPALPLYRRITAELRAKGMTKTQLHQRSGVARSTIEDWKTQPRPPLPSTVNAIADALAIDRTEAQRLAGLIPGCHPVRDGETVDLSQVSSDELLAEIRRRLER
jgi:transcriptional regulator with XRE-family HTH domain